MAVALTTSTDGINRLAITNNSASNERKANASRWLDASATAVRSGIIPGPGVWALSYGSPAADTYYVTAGSAVLADGAGGAVEVTSGSTKSEAVTRPGAGTSRYDVIALEPVFTGTPSVSIVRYAGTAAASPLLSTATSQVTANGLILGYYQLGVSGPPTITQLPKRTAPAGAAVRVYDAADLATLNPVDGDVAYQEDTDIFYGRVSGAWAPIGPTSAFYQKGTTAITSTGLTAATRGTITVPLSSTIFGGAVPSQVIVSAKATSGFSTYYTVGVDGVAANQFTFAWYCNANVSTGLPLAVDWVAYK